MLFRPVPALAPGAHIRVVAPASPFSREDFAAGVARLQERYRVSHEPDIFERDGYLAGSDARRASELRRALEDPNVHAIVAARGGYGTTRLLDRFRPDEVPSRLMIGFSDLTALHALFARAGHRSLHASMVCAIGRGTPVAFDRWVAIVEGRVPEPFGGLDAIAPGRCRGPLVGGNLAVLAALAGTPYAPPLDGCVLFLEEVGEAPYRIDRMLTTLRHAGWFDRVRAIAIGQLTRCEPGPDGREIAHVLADHLAHFPGPVVCGIPAGHEPENSELPFGAPVTVDAQRGVLTFEEGAVVASR